MSNVRTPRAYQIEAHDVCFNEYYSGVKTQCNVLPTGTGKTFLEGMIIKSLPMKLNCAGRTLWLTHEEALIEQSAISVMCTLYPEYEDRILKLLRDDEGVISFLASAQATRGKTLFDQKQNLDYQVEALVKNNLGIIKQRLFDIQPRLIVASIQTIANRLDRIPPDWFDLIVADECHLAISPQWSKVLSHFKPKLLRGTTATPDRLDGFDLSDRFEKVVFERDLKWGIDNGYLCELEAIVLETGLDLSGVSKKAGDFNQKDLSDIIDNPVRNLKIVRKWQEVAKGRPTIAFCTSVEHAKNLCEEFQNCGENFTIIVGDEKICPDRKKRTKDFMAGKYDGVCVVQLLTVGFDYPDVGCTISAAPTMSRTKFMQGPVGRGTRLKTPKFREKHGKNNCIIIDVTDNSKRHALVNTNTLDSGKTFEEKVFMGSEKRADLIAQREARKLKHVQEKEETFNLLALPKPIVKMDAPWMKEPPTQKQLDWIARLGYDIVNVSYTRGQVSQIIGGFDCSQKELDWLAENGFDVSTGASKAQYEAAQKVVLTNNTTKYFNNSIGKNSPIKGIN